MGEVYGISRQTVQQIRNGKTYADVRPDIPRVGGRSCKKMPTLAQRTLHV